MGRFSTAAAAILAVAFAWVTCPAPAGAAQTTFVISMNGLNEVDNSGNPGVGDPDGLGSGTITLDDVADTVSWDFAYQNISGTSISGFHIHGPNATLTTNQPVWIPLEPLSSTAVPNGTQIGTRTTAQTADLGSRIDQLLANPTGFYVNLHSAGVGGFPAGAVRGQVPEPSGLCLLALGALAALPRRGRRRGRDAAQRC